MQSAAQSRATCRMATPTDAMTEIGLQNRVSQLRQRDPYVPNISGCAGVLQAAAPEVLPGQCAPLTLTRPRVCYFSGPGAEQQHASIGQQRHSRSSGTFLSFFFKREVSFI